MTHVLSNLLTGQDPDSKIQREYREKMNVLAELLDEYFNEPNQPKTTAFALLIAPFGADPNGRVNYISNAERADMLKMMRTYIDQQPKDKK